MQYLRTLSDIAMPCALAVTRGLFLASAHRGLNVALAESGYCLPRWCPVARWRFRASGGAWGSNFHSC
jgi:hypothetical protein